MDEEKIDFSFKILLLGNSDVGKSSIFVRYFDKGFEDNMLSIIGQDDENKIVEKDGKIIQLQIFDTAGQERFRSVAKNLYKGADGILIVYDISDQKTFDSIEEWIESLEEKIDLLKVGIIIAENKYDLFKEKLKLEELKKNESLPKEEEENYKILMEKNFVTDEMKNNFKKKYNYEIMKTSAKDNFNINEIFNKLIEKIITLKKKKELTPDNTNKENTLKLDKPNKNKKKKGLC